MLARFFFRYNFQGFLIISTSRGTGISTELMVADVIKKPLSGEVLLKVNL